MAALDIRFADLAGGRKTLANLGAAARGMSGGT